MTKEYSVACLLHDASFKSLSERAPFLEEDNYPHVSLFQFRSDDENFIYRVKQELDELIISDSFFTAGIQQVEDNVFLDIDDDGTLKAASERLTDIYDAECQRKTPLSQIDFSRINDEQASLALKYGNYWVRQHFRPHVTLLYNKKACHDGSVLPPTTVMLLPVGLYPIDSMGRIQHYRPFSWKEIIVNEPTIYHSDHR